MTAAATAAAGPATESRGGGGSCTRRGAVEAFERRPFGQPPGRGSQPTVSSPRRVPLLEVVGMVVWVMLSGGGGGGGGGDSGGCVVENERRWSLLLLIFAIASFGGARQGKPAVGATVATAPRPPDGPRVAPPPPASSFLLVPFPGR